MKMARRQGQLAPMAAMANHSRPSHIKDSPPSHIRASKTHGAAKPARTITMSFSGSVIDRGSELPMGSSQKIALLGAAGSELAAGFDHETALVSEKQ